VSRGPTRRSACAGSRIGLTRPKNAETCEPEGPQVSARCASQSDEHMSSALRRQRPRRPIGAPGATEISTLRPANPRFERVAHVMASKPGPRTWDGAAETLARTGRPEAPSHSGFGCRQASDGRAPIHAAPLERGIDLCVENSDETGLGVIVRITREHRVDMDLVPRALRSVTNLDLVGALRGGGRHPTQLSVSRQVGRGARSQSMRDPNGPALLEPQGSQSADNSRV
jgi:hypothetical protein